MRSRRKWRGGPFCQAEVADVVLTRIERRDVPAFAAVDQRIGLDRPARELVLVGPVVLELDESPSGDRLGDQARDLRVVGARGGDVQALAARILAERGDDLLARARQRALGEVLADEVD